MDGSEADLSRMMVQNERQISTRTFPDIQRFGRIRFPRFLKALATTVVHTKLLELLSSSSWKDLFYCSPSENQSARGVVKSNAEHCLSIRAHQTAKMTSDLEDGIDSSALKKLEDIQRQKMIDLFGFDPDSRDSAQPAKLKKRPRSDVSDPAAPSKQPRKISASPNAPSLESEKTENGLIPAQAPASQHRKVDSDFFAGAQSSINAN